MSDVPRANDTPEIGRDGDAAPAVAARGEEASFLVFKTAGSAYAVAPDWVDYISSSAAPVPVPTMPSHFRGILYVRGRVVSVIDLASFLSLQAAADSEQRDTAELSARMVVLARDDRAFGFQVEEVVGLRTVTTETIRETQKETAQATDPAGGCLEGQFDDDVGVVTVLDPGSLYAALLGADDTQPAPDGGGE